MSQMLVATLCCFGLVTSLTLKPAELLPEVYYTYM